MGGDLYHDNKPSRQCMVKSMKLFKSYVLGDRSVPADARKCDPGRAVSAEQQRAALAPARTACVRPPSPDAHRPCRAIQVEPTSVGTVNDEKGDKGAVNWEDQNMNIGLPVPACVSGAAVQREWQLWCCARLLRPVLNWNAR